MSITVCLVSPPWTGRQSSLWERLEGKSIPFGLGYLAAVLETYTRCSVTIIDSKADGLTVKETADAICDLSPQIVGIGTYTYDYTGGLTLAQTLKENDSHLSICFGGIHCSIFPEQTLSHPSVDFVIRGEGEYTLLEFVQEKPKNTIKGLSFKERGKIIHSPERPLISKLDSLPFLSYHLLSLEKYSPTAGQCRRTPAISMKVSRGCPHDCIFCSSSIGGRSVRRFSPARICHEIQYLVESYGVREIVFMDDTMTYPREQMISLCDALIDKNFDLIWDCSTRVTAVDESLLSSMKEAGCNQISFGIESGDDAVLTSIRKGHTTRQVRKAVKMAHEVGLEVRGSFMIGFPEDTEESILRTIQFSQELDLDLASFYIATPYPGTEMFRWASENERLLTEEWSLFDQSHCVMDIPHVSPEDVFDFYRRAWKSFYLRPRYLAKRLITLRSLYDIKSAFRAVRAVASVMKMAGAD
ncbi:MAG: radical SAM protein [Theionarchaea archaeon]|nr:radical SAM protein [Theionarchaea archaeon]